MDAVHVSPEFILRPSLSGQAPKASTPHERSRVAGVYTPAFVERARRLGLTPVVLASVAGVYTPAFVERGLLPCRAGCP